MATGARCEAALALPCAQQEHLPSKGVNVDANDRTGQQQSM